MCKKCATIVQPVLSPGCLGVAWLWMDEGEKLNRGGGKVEELESRREKIEKNLNQGGEGDGRGGARRPPVRKCTEWASGPPGLH